MKTTKVNITNMHCASCNILIQERLKGNAKIHAVTADFTTKTAIITHASDITIAEINSILCHDGYQVSTDQGVETQQKESSSQITSRITEAVAIAGILGIVLYFLSELRLISLSGIQFTPTFTSLFALGAVASVSTCMATTGAIFASYTATQNVSGSKPHALVFVAGRTMTFALMGALFGFFGKSLFAIPHLGNIMQGITALVLVMAGLDILRIVRVGSLIRTSIFTTTHTQLRSHQDKLFYPFALGSLTYLLPCSFSLLAHSLAISTASPVQSAILLGAFALGTAPSIFAITSLKFVKNASAKATVFKFVGVFAVMLGVYFGIKILTVYDVVKLDTTSNGSAVVAQIAADGKQHIKMRANSAGFTPNLFEVKLGVPVVWETEGIEVYGCQGSIQSPALEIPLTTVNLGANRIEFTPKKLGLARFSCSMGMFGGYINVVE